MDRATRQKEENGSLCSFLVVKALTADLELQGVMFSDKHVTSDAASTENSYLDVAFDFGTTGPSESL